MSNFMVDTVANKGKIFKRKIILGNIIDTDIAMSGSSIVTSNGASYEIGQEVMINAKDGQEIFHKYEIMFVRNKVDIGGGEHQIFLSTNHSAETNNIVDILDFEYELESQRQILVNGTPINKLNLDNFLDLRGDTMTGDLKIQNGTGDLLIENNDIKTVNEIDMNLLKPDKLYNDNQELLNELETSTTHDLRDHKLLIGHKQITVTGIPPITFYSYPVIHPETDKLFIFGTSARRVGEGHFDLLFSTGGLVSLSDINLKENIEPINKSLSKSLLDLKCYNFNMKDNDRKDIGYIAQDVKRIIDNLALENEKLTLWKQRDDKQMLNYSAISIYQIQALYEIIKSQDERIKLLENK